MSTDATPAKSAPLKLIIKYVNDFAEMKSNKFKPNAINNRPTPMVPIQSATVIYL